MPPNNKETLKGNMLKDVIPWIAKAIIFAMEYLELPICLGWAVYSIPICLNPSHDIRPLIKSHFSSN